MGESPDQCHLLLCEADSGSPALESGAPADQLTPPAKPEASGSSVLSFRSRRAEWNELAVQRWGIVLPQGSRGDRLRNLLDPLVKRRSAQQGGLPVAEFRVPATMGHTEAQQWQKRHFDNQSGHEDDIPLYVLIAGDLDEVPSAVEQVLAAQALVGRLAFDLDDDYRRYCAKVARWEDAPPPPELPTLLLHSVRDGTAATHLGHTNLVAPLGKLFQRRVAAGKLPVAAVQMRGDPHGPTPADFLSTLDSISNPGVLFSMSHGAGAPRNGWASPDDQRARQGAIGFGPHGTLPASALAERNLVPGGVWFMFSCFGAGTPTQSAFHHWLEHLSVSGGGEGFGWVQDALSKRPFVAQIPKVALASEQGPLAFVGHLDLAWTYGFTDGETGQKTPGTIYRVVDALVKGHRVGAAMGNLSDALRVLDADLADRMDADQQRQHGGHALTPDRARAHVWMRRNDLRAYSLLGDPAVRLPLRHALTAPPASPHVPSVAATAPATQPASPSTSVPDSVDPDELVDAIYRALNGELQDAASSLGMSRSDLRRLMRIYDRAGRTALGLSDD